MSGLLHQGWDQKERQRITRDFSGCPVVKTLPSKARGVGSVPCWGAKIVASCPNSQNRNRSNIVTNLIKTSVLAYSQHCCEKFCLKFKSTYKPPPPPPTPPPHAQLKPSHNLSFHSQQKATSLQWPAKPYLIWPQLLSELSSLVPSPSTGQVIQDTSFFQAKQACSHSTSGSCFALCLEFYSVSVHLSLTFSHVYM